MGVKKPYLKIIVLYQRNKTSLSISLKLINQGQM